MDNPKHFVNWNSFDLASTAPTPNIQDSVETFYADTVSSAGHELAHRLLRSLPTPLPLVWLTDAFGVDLSVFPRLGGHPAARTAPHRDRGGDAPVTTIKITTARGNVILAAGGCATDFSPGSLLAQHRPDLLALSTTNGNGRRRALTFDFPGDFYVSKGLMTRYHDAAAFAADAGIPVEGVLEVSPHVSWSDVTPFSGTAQHVAIITTHYTMGGLVVDASARVLAASYGARILGLRPPPSPSSRRSCLGGSRATVGLRR
ncbi:hypothetical protein GGX14DRAFT_573525 [Mycena pura]|uniref:Uncharacterized protein n=1 Tax=Mycena pura TaxID=153505 RepID=A0AAD6V2Y2_9AGAR|nr:hypothetical protein GGX14DRAFT_573525 [Mycena pura]